MHHNQAAYIQHQPVTPIRLLGAHLQTLFAAQSEYRLQLQEQCTMFIGDFFNSCVASFSDFDPLVTQVRYAMLAISLARAE